MDPTLAFKLEVETRKTREMCSVLSKEELTDLVVSMVRSDQLKNEWMKTFFIGDFYGSPLSESTSDTLTDEETDAMVLWIIGG